MGSSRIRGRTGMEEKEGREVEDLGATAKMDGTGGRDSGLRDANFSASRMSITASKFALMLLSDCLFRP
jgi:hypothetical protein